MSDSSYKRWYDQHATVSKSIRLMETFPPEIQDVIADGIMRLAIRECQAQEVMANLRSLGPDKVLGIFKSKNKRRTYDNDTTVHQAMNYLFILSEENRLFIANQVIEIVNYIYEYLRCCQTYNMVSSNDDIAQLTNAYIDSGAQEAQQLLDKIQKRFNENITQVVLKSEELLIERTVSFQFHDKSKI